MVLNKPHVRVSNVLIPSYSSSHVVTLRYDEVIFFNFTQLETSLLPVKAANLDTLYLALVAIEQSTLFIVPIIDTEHPFVEGPVTRVVQRFSVELSLPVLMTLVGRA